VLRAAFAAPEVAVVLRAAFAAPEVAVVRVAFAAPDVSTESVVFTAPAVSIALDAWDFVVPELSATLSVPRLSAEARSSLAAAALAAPLTFSTGARVAIGVAAAARVALTSASACSAARDNNCMSSGLSTISTVSSSRLS
jgi:hypothetical protein